MAHREIDYSKMADKYESRCPGKDTNWVVLLGPNVNGFEETSRLLFLRIAMALSSLVRWWRLDLSGCREQEQRDVVCNPGS